MAVYGWHGWMGLVVLHHMLVSYEEGLIVEDLIVWIHRGGVNNEGCMYVLCMYLVCGDGGGGCWHIWEVPLCFGTLEFRLCVYFGVAVCVCVL